MLKFIFKLSIEDKHQSSTIGRAKIASIVCQPWRPSVAYSWFSIF